MSATHPHSHFGLLAAANGRRLFAALVLTLAFVLIEMLAGLYANSHEC